MVRSTILALGLAAFALALVGCGGGSSSTISQEEKDKKRDEMKKQMEGMPKPGGG